MHALNGEHVKMVNHIQDKLGLKSHCLPWLQRLLTDKLRAQRKDFAGLTIPHLEAARRDGWGHFVTGKES
jgi:hypothetical protein